MAATSPLVFMPWLRHRASRASFIGGAPRKLILEAAEAAATAVIWRQVREEVNGAIQGEEASRKEGRRASG